MASESLVSWWNEQLPHIMEQVAVDDAAGKKGRFEWGQMVWQELEMWEKLGEPVGPDELEWIVKRRGFNAVKSAFLLRGLRHLGLWMNAKE
jgi:hypothetical protein